MRKNRSIVKFLSVILTRNAGKTLRYAALGNVTGYAVALEDGEAGKVAPQREGRLGLGNGVVGSYLPEFHCQFLGLRMIVALEHLKRRVAGY